MTQDTPTTPTETNHAPVTPAEPAAGGGLVAQNDEDKTNGMLCHALAFAGVVVPFGNLIGPLIWWLMKKDTSPYVDQEGRESVNFQLTATVAMVISAVLMIVLIGFLLLPIVGIGTLVLTIIGTIKATEGRGYRYPINVRVL